MKLSDTEIDELLTHLSGDNAEKRKQAQQFYHKNKGAILPQFADYISRQSAVQKKLDKEYSLSAMGAGLGILVIFTLVSLLYKPFIQPMIAAVTIGGLGLFLWITRRVLRREKLSPKREYTLKLIAESDDPRIVGYILDTLREGNIHAAGIVEPMLYEKLRWLRSADAVYLDGEQRGHLYHLLTLYGTLIGESFDGGKTLAILRALEQIGDMKAYAVVAGVASSGGSDVIREAAKDCMLYIKARNEITEPQRTLLRASENTGRQEELLRAASSNADMQTETLLRVPKE
jgi:hypothetical protein